MGKALASLGLNLLSTTLDWIHYCKSKHTTTKFPIIFTILIFFKNDNCVGGVNLTALFNPNWTAVTLVYLTCYMQTLFQRKLGCLFKTFMFYQIVVDLKLVIFHLCIVWGFVTTPPLYSNVHHWFMFTFVLFSHQLNTSFSALTEYRRSVARSGVLTPKWCSGTPLWCGNFGSGVFIKKGDFSILTCYFH